MRGIYTCVEQLVGGTPLLELQRIAKKEGLQARLLAKLECFNPGGSAKDRPALAMLDDSNTGFILNTIHSRDNCFQYIKEVVKGESYIMLSNEEVEALKAAVAYQEEERIQELT